MLEKQSELLLHAGILLFSFFLSLTVWKLSIIKLLLVLESKDSNKKTQPLNLLQYASISQTPASISISKTQPLLYSGQSED